MATSADNTYATLVHKQIFDAGVQDELRDGVYFTEVADVRSEDGEYIYSRYGSDGVASTTTDDTYTTSTFEYSKDTLGLDHTAYMAEHISMDEVVKEGFMIQPDRINRHAEAIARKINRDTAIATLEGAGNVVDNGGLTGANDGNWIALSDSNPDNVATTVMQKLQEENATGFTPYMMMRPKDAKQFGLYAMNSGNAVADQTILGGFKRSNFFGFDIYVTNDVPHSINVVGTSVIATDVLIVAGVSLTVHASPSTAGQIDLGGDDNETLDNIAACINGGAGAGTAYIEVSAANRAIWKALNLKATVSGTTLTVVGNSAFTFTSPDTTLVVDADGQAANILCGARSSTVLRLPGSGYHSKVLDQVNNFFGVQLRTAQKYDHTVWTKNQPKIVNVKVDA
jgi:hypothetical protein